MDESKRKEILRKFKDFFKLTIATNHLQNLRKLNKLSAFDYNPFLFHYLANFLTGNSDPQSLAKVLIYPRILGTSITTSFGQNLQNAAPSIFQSILGSTTSGLDIEFVDYLDGRKKYCQIKSGPNTINKDDVDTINNHFQEVKNRARINKVALSIDDLIVGVLYGTEAQLSGNYKKVMNNYPVYVGKDFWHRLTGDENFYSSLIEEFGEAAKETNAKKLLEETLEQLAKDIDVSFIQKDLKKIR